MSSEVANDPIRSAGNRFPDMWTFRLMERSRLGFFAGLAIALTLFGLSLGFFGKLVATRVVDHSGEAGHESRGRLDAGTPG